MFKKAIVALLAVAGLSIVAGGSVHADQKIPLGKNFTKVGQYKIEKNGLKHTALGVYYPNISASNGPMTVNVTEVALVKHHSKKLMYSGKWSSSNMDRDVQMNTTLATPGKHTIYSVYIGLNITNNANSTMYVSGIDNIALTDTGDQIETNDSESNYSDPYVTSIGPHVTLKNKGYAFTVSKDMLSNKNIHITMSSPNGQGIDDDTSITPFTEFDIPLTNN